MAAIKFRNKRQNILFILGCTIIRANVVCADKIMLDTILLFLGRSSRAYLHATIYLPAVTIQDRTPEHLSHLQGKFSLTDSRWAKQYIKSHCSSIS